jgi:hypothetical protein
MDTYPHLEAITRDVEYKFKFKIFAVILCYIINRIKKFILIRMNEFNNLINELI